MEVWRHDEYKALKPTGKTHTHNNGDEAFLMALVGTIPIVFKGGIYHIPVEIVVCESFPFEAPLCFVRPVVGMEIKRHHKYVSADGSVNLRYLSCWQPDSHRIATLVQQMVDIFSRDPPVYATTDAAGSGTGSRRNSSNRFASSAATDYSLASATAALPPPPYGATSSSLRSEHGSLRARAMQEIGQGPSGEARTLRDDRNSIRVVGASGDVVSTALPLMNQRQAAIAAVTDKTRRHLRMVYEEIDKELTDEDKRYERLLDGKKHVATSILELRAYKEELGRAMTATHSCMENLDAYLAERRQVDEEAAKASKKAASGGGKPGKGSRPAGTLDPDLIMLPQDPCSKKMLELVAEVAAIEDTLSVVDRALVRHSGASSPPKASSSSAPSSHELTLSTLLQTVRRLSRRQYKAQAHINKILEVQKEYQRRFDAPSGGGEVGINSSGGGGSSIPSGLEGQSETLSSNIMAYNGPVEFSADTKLISVQAANIRVEGGSNG